MEEFKPNNTNGNGGNQLEIGTSLLTGKDKFYLVEILKNMQELSGLDDQASIQEVMNALNDGLQEKIGASEVNHFKEKLSVLPKVYTIKEVVEGLTSASDFQEAKKQKETL